MNSYRFKNNNWKIHDDVDCALQLVVGGWGSGPASPAPWGPVEEKIWHDAILYDTVHRIASLKTEHQGLDKFLRSVAHG